MSLDNLISNFEDRVVTDKWFSFVAFVDEFDATLEGMIKNTQGDIRDLDFRHACERLISEQTLNSNRNSFSRIVSTEFIALLKPELNLLHETVGQLFNQKENKVSYLTAASLAVSLMTTRNSKFDLKNQESFYVMNEIFFPFLKEDDFFRKLISRPQVDSSEKFKHINLKSYRTIQGLQPGDCIFRRQTKGLYNPFRDFGHAGIYLGCDDEGADINDCANHKIIHVVNDKPACQLVTLKEFCEPNGKKESFWGGYQVTLTQAERERVVKIAITSVGQYIYKFTGGYKGPKSYRCDGFIEYCYESAAIKSPPMNYRSGLFEKDNWKTLNPSALRNCLTMKITDDFLCCN